MLAYVKITNHPVFTDVERYVNVYGINQLNTLPGQEIIDFKYKVEYFRDGENITHTLNAPNKPWTIDNNRKVFQRDPVTGEKIPNPDYEPNYPLIDGLNNIYATEPDNEDEQFVMVNAFDYFWGLFNSGTPLDVLFGQYIPSDDLEHKRFD